MQCFPLQIAMALTGIRLQLSQNVIARFHTAAGLFRWHKDKVDNRMLPRFGYKDEVKRSGPLPRMANDSPAVDAKPHDAKNSWVPKRALSGQNDYIDILGDERIHPLQVQYDIPNWLKSVKGHDIDLQRNIKKTAAYKLSAISKVKPLAWRRITEDVRRRYNEELKCRNQWTFTNYKGLRHGPAKDSFKTKYPF